jgi:hypothetical protein
MSNSSASRPVVVAPKKIHPKTVGALLAAKASSPLSATMSKSPKPKRYPLGIKKRKGILPAIGTAGPASDLASIAGPFDRGGYRIGSDHDQPRNHRRAIKSNSSRRSGTIATGLCRSSRASDRRDTPSGLGSLQLGFPGGGADGLVLPLSPESCW